MRALTTLALAICLGFLGSAVLAQTPAMGRVVRDGAIIWRAEVSIAAASVRAGTTLEITAQSGNWYEVVIPQALGGRGERGRIARSQVELLPGSPQPPTRPLQGEPNEAAASPARPQAAAPARRTAPRFPRMLVTLNGGMQTTTTDFSDTVSFTENAEDGQFETSYHVDSAPTLEVGASGMLSPTIGLGATVTRFERSTPGTFSGSIPHPFFFATPRPIAAVVDGMQREELALHVRVSATRPLGSRIQLTGFGGPSFVRVRQGFVSDFTYTDAYPFDTASFQRAEISTVSKAGPGFNIGGDVSVFLTRQVGVGFIATFTRAEVEVPVAPDRDPRVRAGGLHTGAGLRFRF